MSDCGPVVVLEASHDRSQFDCGVEPLNVYLKQYALQNQKKGIVRNYVTCPARASPATTPWPMARWPMRMLPPP